MIAGAGGRAIAGEYGVSGIVAGGGVVNDVPRVALKRDDSTGSISKEPLQRLELQGEVNISVRGGGGVTRAGRRKERRGASLGQMKCVVTCTQCRAL